MIDRQSIIDAIQDLQEQVTNGETFDLSIDEIALEYGVPSATLIRNIERVETVEQFEARCVAARQYRLQTEDVFAPLRDHIQKVYDRQSKPNTALIATMMFVQKTFAREIWPSANEFARRLIKTQRLQRTFIEKNNA